MNLQNSTIEFSSKKLTVKQALDEINRLSDISIFYGSQEPFLNFIVVFSSRTIMVQKALDEIKSQVPVTVVFNKDHVIVKSRENTKKFRIHGIVKENETKENLTGVAIYVKGTTIGTVTDLDGTFSIDMNPGDYQLVCRFMGYQEEQINISLSQDVDLNFLLKTQYNSLKEVNIIGNVTEVKSLKTGRTIETIGSKVVNRLNTNDVNDALLGRINGVWTTKVSGAPGDHHNIKIRGISSILGSTDPLYVVDGVIIPVVNFKTLGILDLNSHDVNSISVLKDASSTALYGCLGGNGVIIIETKKGGGKTSFNFNVKKGIQYFAKRYNLMDAETFLSTLDSSDTKNKTYFFKREPITDEYGGHTTLGVKYPHYSDSLGNTPRSDDFQNELFQTGEVSEYQLSGQGSIKKINYYISGNYYNHKGIIVNSSYDKYTFTGNFSRIIGDKMSIRLLYKGSHQDNKNNLDNYMGNNVIFKGINYEPAYRSTPDSCLQVINRLYYNDKTSPSVAILSKTGMSPDSLFYGQEKMKVENTNSANLVGFYRLNKYFSVLSTISLSLRDVTYSSYLPPNPFPSKFLRSKENIIIINQQYDLTYQKQWADHALNAFIRFRNYNDNVYWRIDSLRNVDLEGLTPESDIYLRGSQAIFGERGSVIRSINSGIFNINYNYKKKYTISLLINFDKLREGAFVSQTNRYPSVALNWDLAKEDILHLPQWINAFNLYVNTGQSGNYPLNSLSNDLYSTRSQYVADNQVVQGAYITNLANHYIVPEKVTETNYGSEISLFKNRVVLSADYYQKTNSDLIIQRPIPFYYGGGFFYQNIGVMKNNGLELGLEITPIDRKDFYWNTRIGYSTNDQYISKLNDGPINFSSPDVLIPDFIARENEPLGAITGYSYQGKWADLSADEIASKKYIMSWGLAYLKMDTTSHKIINEKDKTIIGNSLPDFTFNWLNEIEYKNFSCEMLWYGVIGADKYNATRAATYITGVNADIRNLVLDNYRCQSNPQIYDSSYFLEDASFIRLKTLSFSYAQPKKIASLLALKYTLSFENLVTLTHYSGYDPEATVYTNNNYTDNAMDRGSYPNPKGVYFSINMTF